MKGKIQKFRKVLKFAVVVICLTGFLLQTHEFLELYWTYPTVVDIQVSVPSEIDLPAISFCSTNGLKPSVICEQQEFCMKSDIFEEVQVCQAWPEICDEHSTMNRTFDIVMYNKYSRHSNFNASQLERLRRPVEDILTCRIKSAGQTNQCDLSSLIIGPYFSDTNLFNFCYTINGQWSNPNYVPTRIKKSERIEMEFFIDISDDGQSRASSEEAFPKYNYPSYPGVQLAIHSPYLSLSPYVIGSGFLAGKSYQIKLEQDEKHLLPAPYQTNCTDYMQLWKARGGIGPLNQMMVVEECIYNTSLQQRGCVSFSIDYPHNKTVCMYCEECNDNKIKDECTKQLQHYNQPCDFITYTMQIEEKLVDIKRRFTSFHLKINETMFQKRKGHDCTNQKIWTIQCQKVLIELVFDNYQITNLTYNPKFESIELFSVIGGYMGMYLGVSIVAVYDFGEVLLTMAYQVLKQRRARKKKERMERRKIARMQREKFERLSGYRTNFNRMY